MRTNIVMPRIGTNDNYVRLCRWAVQDGEEVGKGQTLAYIETTKESSEIEAEESGYFYKTVQEHQMVKVNEIIGYISNILEPIRDKEQLQEEEKEQLISAKAKKLIKEHEISLEVFSNLTVIKEKDVLEYLENNKEKEDDSTNAYDSKLLINGAGGFCKVILDILKQRGEYQIEGVLDKDYLNKKNIRDVAIINDNSEATLKSLYQQGYRFMVNAIGFNQNKHDRKQPYIIMKKIGYKVINTIHNRAILEPSVTIGEGNIIAAGAIVGSDTQIKNNCIINAGAIISHDCIIESHSHIASGAVLGGNVHIGENTLVGQGCTIYKGVTIGKDVVITNGVHIFENIPDGVCIR